MVYSSQYMLNELERQKAQFLLDEQIPQRDRNRLGQFATPHSLAVEILSYAKDVHPIEKTITFLDPGLGTGVFFGALLETFLSTRIFKATGYEIDSRFADVASKLWKPFGLDIRLRDFTEVSQAAKPGEQYNLIISNPPYVRHHHLTLNAKARLRQLSAEITGLKPSALAGLYCYFMLICHKWMEDGGYAYWLVPSEFEDVNYGETLREYLCSRVELLRIHRFDAADVKFSDALVSSSIVTYRKSLPKADHQVEFTSGPSFSEPSSRYIITIDDLKKSKKWGTFFTADHDYCVSDQDSGKIARLGDLFTIRRGIATGANNFFILPLAKARELALPEQFLTPILPSPRYLKATHIPADENGWPVLPQRLVLLNCSLPRERVQTEFPQLDAYFLQGEELELPSRYLLKSRSPWYKQEQRLIPPIVCTYMGRNTNGSQAFRFIRNFSNAIAANVYLLLYPKTHILRLEHQQPGLLNDIFTQLQHIPSQALISEGRRYGGGLNKIEPGELESVHLSIHNIALEAKNNTIQLALL